MADAKGNKSKRYISLVIFLGMLVLLFATNPGEAKFRDFLKDKFQNEAESKGVGILGRPAGWLAGLTTRSKDYYLFSTYKITLPDKPYTYLGLLGHFIKIN
jgi:hypothetical protein